MNSTPQNPLSPVKEKGGGTVNGKPIPTIKVLLLGDSGVGKSSLMLRFAESKYDVAMTSTAGVDFKTKKVKLGGSDEVTLQIWDTAGQERFKTITQAYYRGAMGIVLVYDCTDRKSLANIKYWMSNIQTHANQKVQKLIVGNKIDREDIRQVSYAEGKAVADAFTPKIPFMEASAFSSEHVDDIFVTLAKSVIENIDYFINRPALSNLDLNKEEEEKKKKETSCC